MLVVIRTKNKARVVTSAIMALVIDNSSARTAPMMALFLVIMGNSRK